MLSCFNEAVDKADELIALYGRCSPKRLARELDIEVLERDFSKQKGAYKLILKNPFIFIKRDLSDSMKKIVLMHEIGHDRLHRIRQTTAAVLPNTTYSICLTIQWSTRLMCLRHSF